MRSRLCVTVSLLAPWAASAAAQAPHPTPASPAYTETLQVTATRIPEDVDQVPASIQVITPEELRFEIRLANVSLKVADDAPESPIAALLRSGAYATASFKWPTMRRMAAS